ncbi:MAG: PKD domain-containing protein [Flavobacteriales bacterium]|nr:PKD domain-containing protein [Flavobacteriales bacterium]
MTKPVLFVFLSWITPGAIAQCEFVGISVSSSSETQVQLFTPTPFLIPNPEANVHFWDISDTNGNVIIQETTPSDGNTFLFDHNVPITDTIVVCLSITNELAGPGITCTVCDSLVYNGPIIEWEFLNNAGGIFEATEPPIPSYFFLGQSAPCPPRVISFQNFSYGTDSVHWTFPGGDPAFSNEEVLLVTYNEPGDYSFTIEVFNSAGSNSFTSTDEITVYPNPTADFGFSSEGLTVTFENLSEGELPGQTPEYLWDFGDLNTSEEVNPIHTYASEGLYEVTLTINNQCGSNTFTTIVDVNVTGVTMLSDFNRMSINPNPSSGQFELVLNGIAPSDVSIRLLNLMGQSVWQKTFTSETVSFKTTIDARSITPGTYYLHVTSGSLSRSMKVIIE